MKKGIRHKDGETTIVRLYAPLEEIAAYHGLPPDVVLEWIEDQNMVNILRENKILSVNADGELVYPVKKVYALVMDRMHKNWAALKPPPKDDGPRYA